MGLLFLFPLFCFKKHASSTCINGQAMLINLVFAFFSFCITFFCHCFKPSTQEKPSYPHFRRKTTFLFVLFHFSGTSVFPWSSKVLKPQSPKDLQLPHHLIIPRSSQSSQSPRLIISWVLLACCFVFCLTKRRKRKKKTWKRLFTNNFQRQCFNTKKWKKKQRAERQNELKWERQYRILIIIIACMLDMYGFFLVFFPSFVLFFYCLFCLRNEQFVLG